MVGRGLRAAGAPEADEPGDERDEEELADEHLEDRERLADRPGRDEVAVAGRRERRVAEEDVVAGGRVGDAGEEVGVGPAAEEDVEEREQQAEQREDADRSEDRAEVDAVGAEDDAPQDRDGRDAPAGSRRRRTRGRAGGPTGCASAMIAATTAATAITPARRTRAGRTSELVNATIAVSPATATAATRPPQPSGGSVIITTNVIDDQEQDEAVGVADPLGEFERRLAAAANATRSAAALCSLVGHPWGFGARRRRSCSLHGTPGKACGELLVRSAPRTDRLNGCPPLTRASTCRRRRRAAAASGRIRHRLSEGRRLAGIAYRDPEHVAARLTLYGSERLGEPSLEWASRVRQERPDVPRAVIAEELRIQTAQVARIDGAVAGTPFLIALVPGYLAYLWQEGVMERRIAALYGYDPRDLETSAKILVLRGVHPTIDAAQRRPAGGARHPASREADRAAAAARLGAQHLHAADLRRVPLRAVRGGGQGRALADEGRRRLRGRRSPSGSSPGCFPVSFMIAMAWGCESHARSLGHRTMTFYGGEGGDRRGREAPRATARAAPGATCCAARCSRSRSSSRSRFIAYADHVRQTTGINWLGALGALVAASMVIATTVIASRR